MLSTVKLSCAGDNIPIFRYNGEGHSYISTLLGAISIMQTKEPVVATSDTTAETAQSVATQPHTWRTTLQPWWKATLAILPTYLLTRFVLLLLSYFGGVLFF